MPDSVKESESLTEAVDRREAIAGVKNDLNDVAAGRTRPMREALDELARKHQLRTAREE
jgi:hypothetical protein